MDKKRIFIVDDKISIGKIIAHYLDLDYECMYFTTPLEALRVMQEGTLPHLIISDIRMPDMPGDAFLQYLKHNELYKSIPVVMLSSEDSTSERIRLLENGADDYIVKPFNPLELKIRIKRILR
ncbi:MAG: response regulator transcription factor [Alistipes sp.]